MCFVIMKRCRRAGTHPAQGTRSVDRRTTLAAIFPDNFVALSNICVLQNNSENSYISFKYQTTYSYTITQWNREHFENIMNAALYYEITIKHA